MSSRHCVGSELANQSWKKDPVQKFRALLGRSLTTGLWCWEPGTKCRGEGEGGNEGCGPREEADGPCTHARATPGVSMTRHYQGKALDVQRARARSVVGATDRWLHSIQKRNMCASSRYEISIFYCRACQKD